ncbi:hypothetical protein Golax_021844, partial [Gossypium laxum]|nr:hypothetical protein [Gossypium laxum]
PLSVTNLKVVKDQPHQRSNRKIPGCTVRHFDNNNPRYIWLMDGWLTKERRVPTDRLYR